MSSAGLGGMVAYPRNIRNGIITPEKFNKARIDKYVRERFDSEPTFVALPLGYGNPAGTTGAINGIKTRRHQWGWHVKGAGQTILAPVYDLANGLGLNVAQDLTAAEGAEYGFSPQIAAGAPQRGSQSFKIGTHDPFGARLTVRAADAGGLNPFFFGFRLITQAYQTAVDTYTDFFGFYVVPNAAVGDISVRSKINDAAAVNTDTTQDLADNVPRSFEVRVSKTGVCTALLDDKPPTVTRTNFQFDTGDVVAPIAFFLHGAAAPGALYFQDYEGGYQNQAA